MVLRNLNHYIETQVHGDIHLSEHMSVLVADPSFRGTATGDVLTRLSTTYNIPLRWHPGFQMHVNDVPDDFRGGLMSKVAKKIAESEIIHAELIGRSSIEAVKNPQNWDDVDDSPLKLLKFLWHVLLRFGAGYTR